MYTAILLNLPLSFPYDPDSATTTTSPVTESEPWLDPKYLPPNPSGPPDEEQGPIPNPYSTVTPGVIVQPHGALKNGVGGKGRGAGVRSVKPASSYFPKSKS